MNDLLTRDYPPEYQVLCDRLDLGKGINFTPKWAAGADFLGLLADTMTGQRPDAVIECSSGLSTLVLARCCERNGGGRVYSLENGPEFAQRTRRALQAYGLGRYAEVIDAPLGEVRLGREPYQWYDLSQMPRVGAQLLVVDGPPGFLQPFSRYPALPLLRSRLERGATVLLDDAARDDEQLLLRRWLAENPGAAFRYDATARGCARLTLGR